MLEVEIKAALGRMSVDDVIAEAEELGFSYDRTLRETDVYFNGNDRDFRKTDEALRIRSCRQWRENAADGAAAGAEGAVEMVAEAFITYKGPKMDKISGTRVEHEVAVEDGGTAEKLLASLGYEAMFTVDKTRREFAAEKNGRKITLCVDDVTGLEPHIELETLVPTEQERESALQDIFGILESLRIARDNVTRRSYLELLIASAK